MALQDDLSAMLAPGAASQPPPIPPQDPPTPASEPGLGDALGNMLGFNAPAQDAVAPQTPPAPSPVIPASLTSPSAPAPAAPEKPKPVTLSNKFKRTMTTEFNVGEPPGPDNADPSNPDDTSNTGGTGGISNVPSYWDPNWQQNFGGVDDPDHRVGYLPKGFTPKQNPFYFALPVGEKADGADVSPESIQDGTNTALKPWVDKAVPDEWRSDGKPLLKDRWIEVRNGPHVAYGQWGDVGPFGEDDHDYVFGSAPKPSNAIDNTGEGAAGLDVSPAMRTALHMKDNGPTKWRLVNRRDVPPGPWLDYENGVAPATSQK